MLKVLSPEEVQEMHAILVKDIARLLESPDVSATVYNLLSNVVTLARSSPPWPWNYAPWGYCQGCGNKLLERPDVIHWHRSCLEVEKKRVA